MKEYITVCPHDCPDTCSIIAKVKDGKVVATKGDPSHPFTRGALCAKVLRYKERIYSPDRLLFPMKRVGKKGEGLFERISWDEALEVMKEKIENTLDRFGGEAIYHYKGSGTMGILQTKFPSAFFHKLGASQTQGSLCCPAGDKGWNYSVGPYAVNRPESMAHSDLLLVWGMNMATTNMHMLSFFQEAKKKGAKLIVIDPYRNRTAKQADWYLPIRPGTDAALALGMMHVLVEEDLLDHEYIANYTLGFDQLKKELAAYSPKRVEAITGIPVADIQKLARLYGKARAPFIRLGMGLSRNRRGGMSIRTISLLPGLVGAYHKKGGGAFFATEGAFPLTTNKALQLDTLKKPTRLLDKVRLGRHLLEETNPTISLLFIYGGNPILSSPEAGKVKEGLLRDDLFTVVHEQFMTDTAMYADLLLPATTSFEAFDVYQSYGHTYLQKAEPVIAPLGEAWSNYKLYSQLAKKLGFTEDVFNKPIEQLAEELLPSFVSNTEYEDFLLGKPIELIKLEETFTGSFSTPSKKLEFFSETMVKEGYPGLPTYTEVSHEGNGDLHLLTAPAHYTLNTSFGGVESLRNKEERPKLLIHPKDAFERGIQEDSWIEAYNERGSTRLWARLSEDTQRGVVIAEGVWWGKYNHGEAPLNTLANDKLTDMGRGSTLHDNRISVRKI